MKRLVVGAAVAACFSSVAQAAVLGVFDVDGSNSSAVDTGLILENGVEYTLQVTGAVNTRTDLADGVWVDADWGFRQSDPSTHWDTSSSGFDYGLSINNATPDWGPFSLDHAYTMTVFGDGTSLTYQFLLTAYANSEGFLKLTVLGPDGSLSMPIPPAAFLMLGGIAGLGAAAKRRRCSAAKNTG